MLMHGFTTSSLIGSDVVGKVLPGISPNHLTPIGEAYLKCKGIAPEDNPLRIQPLVKLKESIAATPAGTTHYVVLSVAGNDFRVQLSNPIAMLRNIPAVIKRYMGILDQLKSLASLENKKVKPILMFQYRVDAKNDTYHIYTLLKVIGVSTLALAAVSTVALASSLMALAGTISTLTAGILFSIGVTGLVVSNRVLPLRMIKNILGGQELRVAALGALIEKFYQPILKRAKEDGIPILDLPNTFDPYQNLYLSGIEPGVEGGKLIAEGIAHIVQNHCYSSPSKLYAKKKNQTAFSVANNPGANGWRIKD